MSPRPNLSPFGWLVAFLMYAVQALVLMKFLVEHTGNRWYWIGLAFYVILVFVVIGVAGDLNGCARKDEETATLSFFGFSQSLSVFQVYSKDADS
ncbi:Hypothetical predicted protein [Paramuricea clavata]|uniref:Uncharacterized protein n=1 Tax=Paramuricea clavata TaxID=317549 RepID=A0A7D9MGR8_PARCT|nr:Hypothetical predicted protein [Paramuricea clavata]